MTLLTVVSETDENFVCNQLGDDMETAVPTQQLEKEAMDLQNEEQNKMVEDQCQEDAAETAPVSSDEQDGSTEEIEEEAMDPHNVLSGFKGKHTSGVDAAGDIGELGAPSCCELGGNIGCFVDN